MKFRISEAQTFKFFNLSCTNMNSNVVTRFNYFVFCTVSKYRARLYFGDYRILSVHLVSEPPTLSNANHLFTARMR